MNDVDIISIHTEIEQKCRIMEQNKSHIREKLVEIEISLGNRLLSNNIRDRLEQCKSELTIEFSTNLMVIEWNFYLAEVGILLEHFRRILETPIKQNFMGRIIVESNEKQSIITNYFKILQKYKLLYNTFPFIQNTDTATVLHCSNCSNINTLELCDSNYVCNVCSCQTEIQNISSSFRDTERINIYTKYTYDRKIHFRDCLNQYQGKQNCTIPSELYIQLEDQFEKHNLLIVSTDPHIRFSNITKENILLFLKELQYNKHYENVNLIYYIMTGNRLDDISSLEDTLLNDFDILTTLYDKIYKNDQKIVRKNFINTQYVLYQLLRRHRHPCVKEDFSILKTIDRKSFHDDICQRLFNELGWNLDLFF